MTPAVAGRVTQVLTLSLLLAAALPATAADRRSYAVDYIVDVPANHKTLHVRWELAGAEEIRSLVLHAPPERFSKFRGSGRVEVEGDRVRWSPGGPYAHLEYDVGVDHARGSKGRYDSYAADGWILARARDLFPRTAVDWSERNGSGAPRSRARLIFHLPAGWTSATANPSAGENVYSIRDSGKAIDRVRGWMALGKLTQSHQEIDGIMVRVAQAPGSKLAAEDIFAFLGDTLPRLRQIIGRGPEELLIATAPDPMWHGGLSAQSSLFLHGDRPLRTPDKTSPILHELFHVLQPFSVGQDADWIAEGLAEFYSLELQQRAGLLNARGFTRGLRDFARFGAWNVDLRKQSDNAATNNSAPLVMYALDQRIQHATAGQKRLDDVVHLLCEEGGSVDTERFRRAAAKVAGKSLTRFFERHVARGEMPKWERGH